MTNDDAKQKVMCYRRGFLAGVGSRECLPKADGDDPLRLKESYLEGYFAGEAARSKHIAEYSKRVGATFSVNDILR